MSASERLRALDGAATWGPWGRANASNLPGDGPVIKNLDHFDWVATVQVSNVSEWRENAALIVTLRNALPLIADVVEAAENVTFFGQAAHRYNEWHGSQIVLALTALQEHLEGGGA